MVNTVGEKVVTDVLVVGAGGAGTRAAIAAAEGGARVVIAVKDLFGHSGCTPVAMGGLAGYVNYPGDSWMVYFTDTVVGGGFMNNQKLVEVLTKEAKERFEELEEWCAAFDRDEKDEVYLRKFGGHTFNRSPISGDRTGREMMWALKRKCYQNDLISIRDEVYITKLFVTTDGEISGAIGVDLKKGEIVLFECPTVILASGGSGRLWPITFSTKGKVGEGVFMAYEAGAEIRDMEFFQIHPTGFLWPPAVRGRVVSEGVRSDGGILRNSKGERFMEKYDPLRKELATRDYVSRCIFKEVKEGRGSEHGGAYMDVTHLPPEFIERRLASVLETGLVGGIDIRKQMFEVIPEHHYQNGGVDINEWGETRVKGLYACGEVAGGVHGGNRLGSNSLPDLLVFGKRAGERAAEYVKSSDSSPKVEEKQVAEEIEVICRPLKNEKGTNPFELSKKLHDIMFEEMHIARNESGLKRCLSITEEVEEELKQASVKGTLKANEAWVTTMELRSRITVGKMMVRASLMRTESRASLFREDFPRTNRKEWDKNIKISKENGEMRLSTAPLVITYLQPHQVRLPDFPVPGE